nr:ribonuclease H-like domain-containing protein [Tanacetum cinerariifolium]
MRAKRFLQRTRKKITINGSNITGFHKSKVECYNFHKRAPPKVMVTIDEMGFDWSYMAENEALADMALMDFSDSEPKTKGHGPKLSENVSQSAEEKQTKVDKLKNEKKNVEPQLLRIRERMVTGMNYKYNAKKAYPSAQRNMVPRAVLMKNTLRPLNTAHPKNTVYNARPMYLTVWFIAILGYIASFRGLPVESIPDDHVADFHYIDDARDIWNAVKARFGGNAKSKKIRKSMLKQEFLEFRIGEAEGLHKGYDRMQRILSQLNQLKAKPDDEDINLKFLRAFPSSWSQVALTLKTKGGLDLLSFDDLYYKLKTLEVDVKGYNTFSSSQSAGPSHSAFVNATSTSKKMSYGDSPNYSSTTTYSVPSNSKTGSHRSEKLDMEEMDLKWKMAMLSVRVYKFEQKAGRKIDFDKKESASESDGVIVAKEFGMIAGCDSEDAVKEGAAKLYNLITGANSEEANTAGDAGEFALMGVTYE